jgi:uncharacterized protein YcfJ
MGKDYDKVRNSRSNFFSTRDVGFCCLGTAPRGAVSGGVRGAVVGGMVGGSGGAATGAKIGVVTGATRAAINRESQARTEYQATTEYQNAQHSNFNEAPPEVLGTTATGTTKKPSEEAVIRKNGKPIVGITFPSDWN